MKRKKEPHAKRNKFSKCCLSKVVERGIKTYCLMCGDECETYSYSTVSFPEFNYRHSDTNMRALGDLGKSW